MTVPPITLFDKLNVKIRHLLKIRTGPTAVARNNSGPVLQAPGGSISYTEKVVLVTDVPEFRAVLKELGLVATPGLVVEPSASALPVGSGVEIVLGPKLSLIKAPDLLGSRVHLAFDARNDSEEIVSITDAEIAMNGCVLTSKQFFINNGALRVPDPATTFPVVVAAGKTAALNIEFENLGAGPVYSMGLTAEITLRISARPDARIGFVVEELRGLAEMLPKMQDYCNTHQSAIAFDMPIDPGGSA